jgi:hypothetical protein
VPHFSVEEKKSCIWTIHVIVKTFPLSIVPVIVSVVEAFHIHISTTCPWNNWWKQYINLSKRKTLGINSRNGQSPQAAAVLRREM